MASILVASQDDLAALKTCLNLVRKHTPVPHEVIALGRPSSSGEINRGVLKSRGKYVAVLYAGAWVTPGWLEEMIRCLENDRDIGAVLPCGRGSLCLLTTRALISKIGLWDERLEAGGHANADYFMRIRQSGLRIVRSKDAFIFPNNQRQQQKPIDDGPRPPGRSEEFLVKKWCGDVLEFWDDLDTVFQLA